jgi:Fe-S-cluster containining protein
VNLNPWELACLAQEKKLSPQNFRDLYCELGGIRLKFDGKAGWKGLSACSQYIEGFGCSVHLGRPLACRLYPLGRQKQSEQITYIYQGSEFPCLEGCPDVVQLPYMTVEEYIKSQNAGDFEIAQDAYLEIMQNIADMAFVLLLETSLVHSASLKTLQQWRKMGNENPEQMALFIGSEWLDALMLPDLEIVTPANFAQNHNEILQTKAQTDFGHLASDQQLYHASCLMMGLALHLSRGLGANPSELADHWIRTAVDHGAVE